MLLSFLGDDSSLMKQGEVVVPVMGYEGQPMKQLSLEKQAIHSPLEEVLDRAQFLHLIEGQAKFWDPIKGNITTTPGHSLRYVIIIIR